MFYINNLPREDGELTFTPLDSDKKVNMPTRACGHCGRHWVWIKGSGRKRGWCMCCNRITCGRRECDPCRSQEQLIENIEQGKPLDHRPIIATGGWDGIRS